ncbi:hypothetical protein DOY81_004366 [Sarcophaga bullata]|nr:hypothetical protein DOY81_004366 [Sarcophaga bullata]
MENVSRRLSNEDTATSMYLSFDAESTMSTACYKTLEAMTDVSTLSSICLDESNKNFKNNSEDLNITLEAQDDSHIKTPLKTVKKSDNAVEFRAHTPLRALPKNIMNEYKALCSTPSKEQLMKSVELTRGSDATRCIDLGLAFLGVEDERPAYFPPPIAMVESEENKENVLPETEEVSTLSTCSSVEVTTSVIERKMISSVSTVSSTTEEDVAMEEINIQKYSEDILVQSVVNSGDDELKVVNDNAMGNDGEQLQQELNTNINDCSDDNVDATPKAKMENIQYMETITESCEKSEESTPIANECDHQINKSEKIRSIGKPKNATRNTRRSICEPNLETNKPSRILNTGNKRKSLLPTSKKSNSAVDAEVEIPLLMNRMLKITNTAPIAKILEESVKSNQKISINNEKRRSNPASTKMRTSLIPSVAGEKRPFSFTQRMSVVVKTTLNSPARKIARKSLIGGVITSIPRRSVIAQKPTIESSKIKKPEALLRRSLLTKTTTVSSSTKTNTKTMDLIQESTIKSKTIQRSSLMPSTSKMAEKAKVGGNLNTKQDAVYTCNFCNEKFRIKSLLDAHKRSHESDNTTPPFVKKAPTAPQYTSAPLLGSTNQCKYCDKKFALIKALHIHLLQNCSKIPPSEKKKLHYTELNHVEKAQLPNVFNNCQSNAQSAASSVNATPRNIPKYSTSSMHAPKSATDAVVEIKDKNKNDPDRASTSSEGSSHMASQGSVQKAKKLTAHAGVYRTPNYTNHNLTVHGNNKTNNINKVNINKVQINL